MNLNKQNFGHWKFHTLLHTINFCANVLKENMSVWTAPWIMEEYCTTEIFTNFHEYKFSLIWPNWNFVTFNFHMLAYPTLSKLHFLYWKLKTSQMGQVLFIFMNFTGFTVLYFLDYFVATDNSNKKLVFTEHVSWQWEDVTKF